MKSYKLSLYFLSLLLGITLLASVSAHAQTCTQLGAYTYCDTPSGSRIQSDLGNSRGVIVGPRETTPYTILRPSQPSPSTVRPLSPIFIPNNRRSTLLSEPEQRDPLFLEEDLPPLPFPE